MVNHKRGTWKGSVKRGLKVGAFTFMVAYGLNAYSQFVLTDLSVPIVGFILLVAVILVGIIFDIVGVAVAVADDAPFHAKAARKLNGASQSLELIRNADKVANFCCDVVGDICGTLSGGIGAAIVFTFSISHGSHGWIIASTMAGLVAALTVGGKAMAKTFAITRANEIMHQVGMVIFWLGRLFKRQPKLQRGKNNLKGKNR